MAGRRVRRTTSFPVERLAVRVWVLPWLELGDWAEPWMVIFVDACLGADLTVADAELSGVVEMLETTEETMDRSTAEY